MTQPRTELLIIDPQNDFCDLPADWCPPDPSSGARCAPALPVPGAHADLQRLAAFIGRAGAGLQAITITLDSHHRHDIAHPGFWQCGDGAAVQPFTPITAQQVRDGQFAPRQASALPRTLAYLDALEAGGRYTLMVWPVHCQIGSWGHAVHAGVQAACNVWADQAIKEAPGRSQASLTPSGGGSGPLPLPGGTGSPVHAVFKGSNPWTEHYSAVQAEVPDPADADTGLNHALLARLDAAGRILVAGQASSHCVKATAEHLVAHLPGGQPERITLLTDGMSPVAGFEAQQMAFFSAMRQAGVRLATMAETAL
jgi:nicotinamidase-related amidase